MLNQIFVCAQLILTAPLVLTHNQDPCNAYSQFPEADQRFIENNATANLNDRLLRPDWYGVEGFEIPNSGLAEAFCGAQFPVGVLGHLDTQNTDVQKVKVCVYAGGKCYEEFSIEAKICKKLTIYKTIRSPVSGAAYCLAQKSGKAFHDFKAEPVVRLDFDLVYQGYQYRYYCDFNEHKKKNLKYQSIWLINGFQINRSSKFVDYNDKKGRSLTDDQLLSSNAGVTSVGFKISCGIRASSSDEAYAGFPSIGQEIFIGITVLYPKNGIVIPEGESGVITIKATAPIGTTSDKDRLVVHLQTPTKNRTRDLELTTDSGCGIIISPKEWNQTYQIKLKTSITQSYDNVNQLIKVKLRTPKEYRPHKIWGNYTVFPLVDVYVTKSTKKIEGLDCGLTSDPRLHTFTHRYYSMQLTGTFILYQNNDYEIEVQVKNFKCHRDDGYCVCGIVVKAGRTAFMINVCEKKNKRIDYVACGDSADVLNVMKNGDFEYKVKLPHKGTVKITIRDRKSPSIEWLNVIIYPSIVDFPDHPRSVHLGLCGGITEEEETRINEGVLIKDKYNVFFERWRIQERDSLFDIANLEALQNSVPSITYRTCRCSQENSYELNENINCKVYPDEAESDKKFKHVNINIARCNAPGRKRRSLATFQHEAHEIVKRDVSWRNGWTEEKARLYCQKLFNDSNMIKKCKDVPGVNLSAPLKSCFDDIQLTGTDIFALSALDTVRSKCLYEVKMNVTLQEKQSDKPSVFQVVQDIACLGDCSQRGECKKGICICNPGYIGSDCSVDANERPSAENLDTDGYCDLSRETCDKIAVFGGIFIDSDHFLCKMDKFQVSISEKLTIKRGISLKGNVESIGEVTCPLPSSNRKRRNAEQVPVIDNSVEGYRIAVSNTGNVYSEWLTMVTFNSQCVSCEIKGDNVNCTFSSDYCYSDNRCYRNGERHRTNRDYVCDSKRQMWIKSEKKRMSNDEWTMLGVGIGVAVLIIFVVTIICLKQKRCNRKSKHQATVDVVRSPNDIHIYESLKRERGTENHNPYLGLQNMKTKFT